MNDELEYLEVRKEKMPRCYMVKKGRHQASQPSPPEGSVAPSYTRYQPVILDPFPTAFPSRSLLRVSATSRNPRSLLRPSISLLNIERPQHEEEVRVDAASNVIQQRNSGENDMNPSNDVTSDGVVSPTEVIQENDASFYATENEPFSEHSAEDRQAAQDLLSLSQGQLSLPQPTVYTVLQPSQPFLISYNLPTSGIFILTEQPQTAMIPTTIPMQSNYTVSESVPVASMVVEVPPPPSQPAPLPKLVPLTSARPVAQIKSVKYDCSECGKIYATSSNLSRHKQTHRSLESSDAKRCMVCGKTYVSMPALAMHEMTHSLGHSCSVCGKQFSRSWLLRGHVRSHTGEKPYTCACCGKAFADRSNFRAHLQTHSEQKKFTCHQCGRTFALKSYLNKHFDSSFCGRQEHE